MAHSSNVIDKIKKLRNDGHTLTEIVYKTGLSKTTIFGHIKNIPQSEYLREKIRIGRWKGQRFAALGRRGKSVKGYIFNRPTEWDPSFVNLVGHFMFDGQLPRTVCAYNNRSQVLINCVIRGMKKYLNVVDYKIYHNTFTGVVRVSYNNVEIASFIKTKTQELLDYILLATRENKISFLVSFFDDEGSINFRNNGRAVRGYQHSYKILGIIQKLLYDLGIQSKIDKKQVEISISKKENLIKFQKIINFSPGLRVNGNRSNSVWKKDLEKRKILDMAINSYL